MALLFHGTVTAPRCRSTLKRSFDFTVLYLFSGFVTNVTRAEMTSYCFPQMDLGPYDPVPLSLWVNVAHPISVLSTHLFFPQQMYLLF